MLLGAILPTSFRPLPCGDETYLLDHPQWLSPEVGAEILWDFTLNESKETKLVEKAVKGTLTSFEEVILIEALKSTPEQALEWGINAEAMPSIINGYTQLACQIFYSLNNFAFVAK
eukprot:TRINITY_DN9612_c0_g1_i11.p2 TRINITY_DN9612_c0_g1~~TRINITY_DN9612_c0_g1_i11.p2  ORF type:complete len:116 (+),score=15.97 TRINITY_DN9612_c0_g1_i11:599-946(+)